VPVPIGAGPHAAVLHRGAAQHHHVNSFRGTRLSRNQDANAAILDELVALADKAARTIHQLQHEIQVRDSRIRELEQTRAELERDAHWCRWFRNQYRHTPLLSAVDAAFDSAHADFASSIGAAGTRRGDKARGK
jgi:phage shock protein A